MTKALYPTYPPRCPECMSGAVLAKIDETDGAGYCSNCGIISWQSLQESYALWADRMGNGSAYIMTQRSPGSGYSVTVNGLIVYQGKYKYRAEHASEIAAVTSVALRHEVTTASTVDPVKEKNCGECGQPMKNSTRPTQ